MHRHGRFNYAQPAEAGSSPQEADVELLRLRDELAVVRATLADREAALAKAAFYAEQARELWQQETQAAVSNAEQVWKAEEAARLAAAEAQWRKESASALAEATVGSEAANGVFGRLREEAARERSDVVGHGLLAKPVNHETEFEQVPSTRGNEHEPERETQQVRVVIRPNRIWEAETLEQELGASRTYATRGGFVAASLAVVAFTAAAYSSIGYFQQSWQTNTAVVTAHGMAVVIRDVNVRASPSTGAAVVSTLPSGQKVAAIERRGTWTLVEIDGDSGSTKLRRGWVSSSFLKDE